MKKMEHKSASEALIRYMNWRNSQKEKTARPNAMLDNPVCRAKRKSDIFTPVPTPINRE